MTIAGLSPKRHRELLVRPFSYDGVGGTLSGPGPGTGSGTGSGTGTLSGTGPGAGSSTGPGTVSSEESGMGSETRAGSPIGTGVGPVPDGYRLLSRTTRLPRGTNFVAASADLFGWQLQQRAGIGIAASAFVIAPGVVADLRLGPGSFALRAPVRIVGVIDEPDRRGFAYGTLPGHPVAGEESFVLTSTPAGGIDLTITAFSREASWLARRSGGLTRRVQRAITDRYLRLFAAAYS